MIRIHCSSSLKNGVKMRKVELLVTPDGKCPVRDFIDTLPVKTQAKTYATFKIVQSMRIVPEKFFKKMTGSDLYEIRVLHDKMLYRYLSFFTTEISLLWLMDLKKVARKLLSVK
jgi:hypothetical protein